MKNPIHPVQRPFSQTAFSSGFTLIEIMVVIVIISILMTAGVMGLRNLSAGKGTSSAISNCEALFNEARTIAVSKRCKVRVLVDTDDINSDNYLTRVVIAQQKFDNNGDPIDNEWLLSSRAYRLPDATYFSLEYSKQRDGSDLPDFNLTGDNISTNYQGQYTYYEFNDEGLFVTPGASFIVGAGIRPKGQEPRFVKSSERDLMGFVIWKNGRTSSYRNPEHMNIDESKKTF
jgi:prepilin-type N-terminal cleavage/methylation domain-containing protein